MGNTLIYILQIFVSAGLAVWLWLLRPGLAERGWHRANYYAASLSIAAAIVAAGTASDLLAGKHPPGVVMFFGGIVLVGLLVNVARNAWSWLLSKIGLSSNGNDEQHRRGAKIADGKTVARMLRDQPSRFAIGDVPVPVELETRGFLLAGSPGTGKSQALTHALDALRNDGARAVVADASGIYLSRYYSAERGDIVLNPFDARCAAWSPLAEAESVADVPALAKSLVPDGDGSAAEWNGYAQTFVEAVIEFCLTNALTNADLYRLVCVATLDELRDVCSGTPAAPLVSEGNERMFGSVRAIAASACRFVQYLDPQAGANGFSIRRHIADERRGWVFLAYQQQHRDAQKSQIACAIDVAARAVLSLPPSLDRRVIFSLDELPLLGKIQSIVDLATNGRKHGATIFAGLQTIAQVREAYGQHTAQTLLACLGSWLVLRVADAETAEYMSKYLGDEEKTRVVQSGGTSQQSMQIGGSRSENWSEQIVKDRVVMPSELQSLPDLRGIFNLAGPVPSAIVTLQIAPQRKTADAFIAAPTRAREKPQPQQQQQQRGAGGVDRDAGDALAPDLL